MSIELAKPRRCEDCKKNKVTQTGGLRLKPETETIEAHLGGLRVIPLGFNPVININHLSHFA